MNDKPYNLTNKVIINDIDILNEFKDLIYANDDIRPTWQGGGGAHTDLIEQYYYIAHWANQHWGLYRGFLFNENINYNDPLTILDIGCGSGYCTRNLAEIFPNSQILALDIDRKCLDFCTKYNSHEIITYGKQDITLLAPMNNTFDYIFCIETLEHIAHVNHIQLVHNMLKSLKNEQSKLFISTPKSQDIEREKTKGHIGILNDEYYNIFEFNFRRFINYVRFYDMNKLTDDDPVQYTTFNPSNGSYQICLSNYFVNL